MQAAAGPDAADDDQRQGAPVQELAQQHSRLPQPAGQQQEAEPPPVQRRQGQQIAAAQT